MISRQDRDRWQRIKELFAAAATLPVDHRVSFLEHACGDDGALRREVEELLAAHEAADNVFETGVAAGCFFSDLGLPLPGQQLAPGRRIGQYEIVEAIGAGGMGEVYRAVDTRLHRDVALKVLPPALVSNPARRARFVQEARAASALEHPHIAVVHEIGEADAITFIVMELVRGEPLAAVVSRGPIPPGQAIDLAVEIAEGLARAHDIGIVHRDLKPANVMITADGHVKIIDFGLAKLTTSTDADEATGSFDVADGLTEAGVVVGTAAYMSPEQAQGAAADHRSDIFTFGVVLHEMLSGSSPFRRSSSLDTLHAIVHDVPPRLPASTGVTADLQRVIDACLAKAPGERYQHFRDVMNDLRSARRRLHSAELRAIEGSPRVDPRLRIAAIMAVAVTMAGAAAVWFSARRAADEAERTGTVAQVKRFVDDGQFVNAWRVARPALRRWPGESQLELMLRATSQAVTLATDPPGADVAFKAYDDPAGEWVPIGRSPLKDVAVPLGMLRWRLTKPGFDPLEARLEVGTPAAAAGRPDVTAKPIRLRPTGGAFPRMVFVAGGAFSGVQLADYWIDQFEVTNREFKTFVDRGHYDPRFRDSTGSPGPSTWRLGTYPVAQDSYPVRGVSWFEAVAYCQSVGKTLPTFYHWRRAFGATYFAEVVQAGNFGGTGPESTDALRDVGPFGTYGLAGNVKEWVWNEVGDRNYILGGAWNEPIYMAVDDDARPPLDRAEVNGFRCMKESARSSDAAYAPRPKPPARDRLRDKPVDDATFEIFRRFYSYERTPLDARTESVQESQDWRRERVSFAASYGGERVLVNILIPKGVPPPYQAVVWFPGGYALELRHSDGDLPFSYYFDFLPRGGRALVYPVYKGTYERADGAYTHSPAGKIVAVQRSQDLSRTIDYLASRKDFDTEQVAYYGFSLGACCTQMAGLALEPRFKAAILLSGGLTASIYAAESDPINFLPRIKTPVLMLGGEFDFETPVETSQKPFFDLLGTRPEQKRFVIFDEAGHVPPRRSVIPEVLAWLDRYLGPVHDQQ